MNKVEHLLKLADEYEAKAVLDLCVKCLRDEPKSEENAVKILFLANSTVMAREDDRLESVRNKCYDLIKNMELTNILGKNDFKYLDRDIVENVFVQRGERLETFLKEIYPQFIGLVEYALSVCMGQSPPSVTPCPRHFSNNTTNNGLFERIKNCSVCRRMIEQLVSASKRGSHSNSAFQSTPAGFGGLSGSTAGLFGSTAMGSSFHYTGYWGKYHFDEKLISIIRDFHNILKL